MQQNFRCKSLVIAFAESKLEVSQEINCDWEQYTKREFEIFRVNLTD